MDVKNRLLYFTANGRESKRKHLSPAPLPGEPRRDRPGPDGPGRRPTIARSSPRAASSWSITHRGRHGPPSRRSAADGTRGHAAGEGRPLAPAWSSRAGSCPETFIVKAADGVTDLYGNMWKPFDFDPKKSLPDHRPRLPRPPAGGDDPHLLGLRWPASSSSRRSASS